MANDAGIVHDLLTYAVFSIATVGLYLPSVWARMKFSGAGFTETRLWAAIIYNIVIATVHGIFISKSEVVFYGFVENSGLGWLSLVMIFLHAFTNPKQGTGASIKVFWRR